MINLIRFDRMGCPFFFFDIRGFIMANDFLERDFFIFY